MSLLFAPAPLSESTAAASVVEAGEEEDAAGAQQLAHRQQQQQQQQQQHLLLQHQDQHAGSALTLAADITGSASAPHADTPLHLVVVTKPAGVPHDDAMVTATTVTAAASTTVPPTLIAPAAEPQQPQLKQPQQQPQQQQQQQQQQQETMAMMMAHLPTPATVAVLVGELAANVQALLALVRAPTTRTLLSPHASNLNQLAQDIEAAGTASHMAARAASMPGVATWGDLIADYTPAATRSSTRRNGGGRGGDAAATAGGIGGSDTDSAGSRARPHRRARASNHGGGGSGTGGSVAYRRDGTRLLFWTDAEMDALRRAAAATGPQADAIHRRHGSNGSVDQALARFSKEQIHNKIVTESRAGRPVPKGPPGDLSDASDHDGGNGDNGDELDHSLGSAGEGDEDDMDDGGSGGDDGMSDGGGSYNGGTGGGGGGGSGDAGSLQGTGSEPRRALYWEPSEIEVLRRAVSTIGPDAVGVYARHGPNGSVDSALGRFDIVQVRSKIKTEQRAGRMYKPPGGEIHSHGGRGSRGVSRAASPAGGTYSSRGAGRFTNNNNNNNNTKVFKWLEAEADALRRAVAVCGLSPDLIFRRHGLDGTIDQSLRRFTATQLSVKFKNEKRSGRPFLAPKRALVSSPNEPNPVLMPEELLKCGINPTVADYELAAIARESGQHRTYHPTRVQPPPAAASAPALPSGAAMAPVTDPSPLSSTSSSTSAAPNAANGGGGGIPLVPPPPPPPPPPRVAWTAMATATLLEAVAEYGPQWRRIYAMYGPRGSITPRSLPAIASLADLAAHAMQCVADGTAPAEVANAAANPSTFFADMDVVVLPSGELGGGSAPPMPLPLPLSSPAASSSLAAMTPMSMMLSGGGPAPLFAVPASAPPPPPSALMATTTAVPEGESEALLRAGAKRSFAQSAGGTEAADAIDRELYQLQA